MLRAGGSLSSTTPTQDLAFVVANLSLSVNLGSAITVRTAWGGRGAVGFWAWQLLGFGSGPWLLHPTPGPPAVWPPAAQATFPDTTVAPSVPLANLLGPAARACLVGQDRAACNAVANLCVLQLYDS